MVIARVRMQDGRIGRFDVPEGTTPEEVLSFAQSSLGQEPQAPDPEPEDQGFGQRFREDVEDRFLIADEIERDLRSGEIGTAQAVTDMLGKVGAGTVLDFLEQGVVSAARGVSKITPDFIEDPIKEGVKDAGVAFLNTDIGKAGLEAVDQGFDVYSEFKRNNPSAARSLESVVNLGLIFSPVKGRPAAPPTGLERAGKRVTQAGFKQAAQKKVDFVTELVQPKRTAKVAREQLGRTTEEGLLRTRVVAPSAFEKTLVNEVNKLPVSSTQSLTANLNVIQKAVNKETNSLKAALSKNDVFFPRKEFNAQLDGAIQRLKDAPILTGKPQKVAVKTVEEMKKLAANKKSSATGLLEARKQFDRLIESQKGPGVFDPVRQNAQSFAIREIRQTTNNFIDSKATNVAVKDSLKRQSRLLSAMDNIGTKATEEGANAAIRAWQNVGKLLPLRGEFNQSMATLFGIGGLGASAKFAPFFTSVAAGGLGTVGLTKAIRSPQAKKTLGSLLKVTDQAIRKTKDKDLIRQLRLDRAAVTELLESEE